MKKRCKECGAAMYYDGRCADDPVCPNPHCDSRKDPDDYYKYGGGTSMRTEEIPDCKGCGYYDCIFCGGS